MLNLLLLAANKILPLSLRATRGSAAISTFFYEIAQPVPSKAKESFSLLAMIWHQVFLVNYELKVISLPEFISADEKTKNMEENVRKIAALCMSLKPNIG